MHVFPIRNWCNPIPSEEKLNYGRRRGTGFLFEKTEALYAELNQRAEATASSYSAIDNFVQYFYSVLMVKNHQKIRSRCLIYEFSFTDIFKHINHGFRATILMKNYSWLLPFYMALVTYCFYEKVRRTMCNTIASCLLKCCWRFWQINHFVKTFTCKRSKSILVLTKFFLSASLLLFKNLFLNLDLFIISLLNIQFINWEFFPLTYFFLSGAYILKTSLHTPRIFLKPLWLFFKTTFYNSDVTFFLNLSLEKYLWLL